MTVPLAAAPERAKPGRPSTGARERILAGCLDVLKESGYAGLSIAKVAAASGESKALISYHFGSRAGLVAASAKELGDAITAHVLEGLDGAVSVEDIVRGAMAGTWDLAASDERLPRVYFDLNAVSVVDDEIRAVMRDVKEGFRAVLARELRQASEPVPARHATTLAVLIIAGIEGLMLERIERGETAELAKARELFVDSIVAVAWA